MLRTTSPVGGIKLSFKVQSVVILRYLPTRLVTTTGGYMKLQGITACHRELEGVTGDNKRLQKVTRDYKELQGVKRGYRGLRGVTGGLQWAG